MMKKKEMKEMTYSIVTIDTTDENESVSYCKRRKYEANDNIQWNILVIMSMTIYQMTNGEENSQYQ